MKLLNNELEFVEGQLESLERLINNAAKAGDRDTRLKLEGERTAYQVMGARLREHLRKYDEALTLVNFSELEMKIFNLKGDNSED